MTARRRPWTDRLVAACRAVGVTDARVLDAMAAVDRSLFVDGIGGRELGRDRPLQIPEGQTTSQPSLIAQMIQQLELQPHHRVLEVGTGSGYATAALALLVDEVVSVERHLVLADKARERLAGFTHVRVIHGDGTKGWPDGAPYDAIMVGATGEEVPGALLDQMTDDGRLVMPVRSVHGEWLERHRRVAGRLQPPERLVEVRFVPLIADP